METKEKMEVRDLSKSEYLRMKARAISGASNNSRDQINSYHVIEGRNTKHLIFYCLSMWEGENPSYTLYRNVDEEKIEEISGIPIEEFIIVDKNEKN